MLAHLRETEAAVEAAAAAVAVEREQRVLVDIAKNASDSHSRIAALERVADQKMLAAIVKGVPIIFARTEEVIQAVQRVTDQSLLADIARNARNDEVSEAAASRLTDQGVLADIARTAWCHGARLAAVHSVIDQSVLADIARTAKDSNVCTVAIRRVISISAAAPARPGLEKSTRAIWMRPRLNAQVSASAPSASCTRPKTIWTSDVTNTAAHRPRAGGRRARPGTGWPRNR